MLRNTTYTSPATVYLGLFTADPGEASGATEITGNGYARTAMAFAAPSSGACASTGACTFPTCVTAPWGDISHWVLFDASTSGNRLYHGSFDVTKTVGVGDTFTVPSGSMVISED